VSEPLKLGASHGVTAFYPTESGYRERQVWIGT
jgi:hypothetical protein